MQQGIAILALVVAGLLVLLDAMRLLPRRPCAGSAPLARGERGLYLLFVLTLALMTISSIVVLAFGAHMRGWMLLLHMTVAPIFCIAIAVLAVRWVQRFSCLVRLILLMSFATIITALFMMMTWFGTDWQRCWMTAHTIVSGILFAAVALQVWRLLFAKDTADVASAGR